MTSNRSSCCNATVTVVNQDEGTNYYACDKCKMPCDVAPDRSKEWTQLRVGDAGDIAEDYFTIGDIDFIQSLLDKQRADLIDKVEGMRVKSFGRNSQFKGLSANAIYNQSISDVLQLLKGEK